MSRMVSGVREETNRSPEEEEQKYEEDRGEEDFEHSMDVRDIPLLVREDQ